jgi:DNA-binding MarR family transcriptional regulator
VAAMPRLSVESKVNDLTHAVGMLVRRVRSMATEESLSMTESVILARLYRNGPTTTAELARIEGMRPQSMRATVSALEKLGIAARKADPVDGRQMLIALTPYGLDVLTTHKDAKRSWLVKAVTQLAPSDRETLFAAADIMRRLAES